MKSAWLSYAWADNNDGDVDFFAQELKGIGLNVKLDRWNIQAGKRLWEQIENFIQDPKQSDGWILFATQNSLGSEPCKEEFSYALDRALRSRGANFPVIGLFQGAVDQALIPAGIRTRLYVSVTDPDWKERIVAAFEDRDLNVSRRQFDPFVIKVHDLPTGFGQLKFGIEVRPRAGSWIPFSCGIPIVEKNGVSPVLYHGGSNKVPMGSLLKMSGDGPSSDGKWWIEFAGDEATPTQSYYLLCQSLPSELVFGVSNGQLQYRVKTSEIR